MSSSAELASAVKLAHTGTKVGIIVWPVSHCLLLLLLLLLRMHHIA